MATATVFNLFPAIAAAVKPECQAAVTETSHSLKAGVQVRAPVDTGFMRDSTDEQIGVLEAWVWVGAYYGIYVEMGHHVHHSATYVPANPFFYPAVDAERPLFEARLSHIFTV